MTPRTNERAPLEQLRRDSLRLWKVGVRSSLTSPLEVDWLRDGLDARDIGQAIRALVQPWLEDPGLRQAFGALSRTARDSLHELLLAGVLAMSEKPAAPVPSTPSTHEDVAEHARPDRAIVPSSRQIDKTPGTSRASADKAHESENAVLCLLVEKAQSPVDALSCIREYQEIRYQHIAKVVELEGITERNHVETERLRERYRLELSGEDPDEIEKRKDLAARRLQRKAIFLTSTMSVAVAVACLCRGHRADYFAAAGCGFLVALATLLQFFLLNKIPFSPGDLNRLLKTAGEAGREVFGEFFAGLGRFLKSLGERMATSTDSNEDEPKKGLPPPASGSQSS